LLGISLRPVGGREGGVDAVQRSKDAGSSATVEAESATAPHLVPKAGSAAQSDMLRQDAARLVASRKLRSGLFDPNLFGEPAWDILLSLYVIHNDRRRMSIRALADHCELPLTTMQRWLDYLSQRDLVRRLSNPADHRVIYIEMAEKGRQKMDAYFLRLRHAEPERRA
jgi:DNA-binding MarR family transcriptional regulator